MLIRDTFLNKTTGEANYRLLVCAGVRLLLLLFHRLFYELVKRFFGGHVGSVLSILLV